MWILFSRITDDNVTGSGLRMCCFDCINDKRRLGRGLYCHGTTSSPLQVFDAWKSWNISSLHQVGDEELLLDSGAGPDTSSQLLSTIKVTSSWFRFLGDCGHLPGHLCLGQAGLFCPCSLIPPCGSLASSTSSGKDSGCGCGCVCIHTKS